MGNNERNLTTTDSFEHLGVSSDKLSKGLYDKGGISIPVIIKRGPDVYLSETNGARALRGYLPIVEPFEYIAADVAIYPLIGNAPNLHEVLVNSDQPETNLDLLTQYVDMHLRMWKSTHTSDTKKETGYVKKIEATQEAILNSTIGKSSLKKFPKSHLFIQLINSNLGIELGRETSEVSSAETALDVMGGVIRESLSFGVSLAHGDENFTNCLVRDNGVGSNNYANPMVMIDLGKAGYRSPFESAAKVLSWLRISQTVQNHFRYGDTYDKSATDLAVGYTLDAKYETMEKEIHTMLMTGLLGYMNIPERVAQKYLDAYQMMYLLREAALYADLRQKPSIVPYLYPKAFSLASDIS